MSTIFKIERKPKIEATTVRVWTKTRDKIRFLARKNGVTGVYLLEQVLDHLLKISGLTEEYEKSKEKK